MTFPITATYAAVFALWCIALTTQVIARRASTGISLGDGGDAAMLEAIRRHGHLTETLPLALILMALAEAGGLPAPWLHVAGLGLLTARLAHPFGIGAGRPVALRVAGTLGSFAVTGGLALFLLARGTGLA